MSKFIKQFSIQTILNQLLNSSIILKIMEIQQYFQYLVKLMKLSFINKLDKGSSCEEPFLGYSPPLAHPNYAQYNLLASCPHRHRLILIEKLPSLSLRICMERHSLYHQSLVKFC